MPEVVYYNIKPGIINNRRGDPGSPLLRLVAVSFCVLCVLQAALNISLRQTFCICQDETSDAEAILKNVTRERDKLKEDLTMFDCDAHPLCPSGTKFDMHMYPNELYEKVSEHVFLKFSYSEQGWLYVNGSFYLISSSKETWQASREDCLQRGADLVIIDSIEEEDFMRHFHKHIWIGLNDVETEGLWKWVDGTPVNTSYWGPDEPNSHEGAEEDCAEIRLYNDKYSWNDKPCKSKNVWICERRVAL